MPLTMVVLPTPGPPVMTNTFELQRESDGGDLAFCERKADALLDPWQRLVRVDPRPRRRAVREPHQPLRDPALRTVQARQE